MWMWIEKGIVKHIYNNQTFLLKENDLLILKPETCHSICGANVYPTLFYNFEVSKKYVHEFLTAIGKAIVGELFSAPFLILKYSNTEMKDFITLLNSAHQQSVSETERMSYLKTIIGHALCKLISFNCLDNNVSYNNSIIRNCLMALNDTKNFSETIKNIFAKIGYSHEHITRLFKKEGLSTPVNLFLQNKLEYSCVLLSSSDLKITDIIELCGFYSPSYYYKIFKKYYGISPSEYRKRYQ